MNQKFKLGDTVKIVSDQGFFESNIGRVGKIVETDSSTLPVKVEFVDYHDDMDSFDWGKYEGIELAGKVAADVVPVVEFFEVGDRVICVNKDDLPNDFGKTGTVEERVSHGRSCTITVKFDGELHAKLYMSKSFKKVEEELTVENVVDKPNSDRINLLTPAQIRVYNAAVRLSEAQKEFTDAINAHHAELQKGE